MKRVGWLVRIVVSALLMPVALLGSCGASDPADYIRFESITDGWDPLDVLVFEPVTRDSVPIKGDGFDIDLMLRYSTRLPVSDFPLTVTLEDENGIIRCDTVIVPAASGNGADIHTSYGIREVSMQLCRNVTLADGFSLSLAPLSDRSLTESLRSCGVLFRRK